MSLKIFYCRNNKIPKDLSSQEGIIVILFANNWDDYTFKTSFDIKILKNSEIFDGMSLQIAYKNQNKNTQTSDVFDLYLEEIGEEYDEFCKITNELDFISINNFYTTLNAILGEEDLYDFLKELQDIAYIKEKEKKDLSIKEIRALSIVTEEEDAFTVSLLRSQFSKKVLYEGLTAILEEKDVDPDKHRFDFNFTLFEKEYKYIFDFSNQSIPSRINILIGKNGSGKTKSLENLVSHLVNPLESISNIDNYPNFLSNLLVISYNPYDKFYIPRQYDNISINYKYVGYRRYKCLKKDGVSVNQIKNNEVFNVVKFITKNMINELEILVCTQDADDYLIEQEILLKQLYEEFVSIDHIYIYEAFNLCVSLIEEIANDTQHHSISAIKSLLKIYKDDKKRKKYSDDIFLQLLQSNITNAIKEINYIVINNIPYSTTDSWDSILNDETLNLEFFDKSNEKVFLSSGQQVYVNMLINIFSLIRYNSLIIIDEPENTLHPNFEIDFIRVLNAILDYFKSFAIIATHSSVITREVPSECINIIVSEQKIEVQKPVIKTLGAATTDIDNYVFDDVFKDNKPYLSWLTTEIKNYKRKSRSFDKFLEDYSSSLSYDLLLEANKIYEGI